MKFLQLAGEDYFLLSTENHLGNLSRLELWTDSVGFNADWYCDSVKIIDIQTLDQYLFKVKKWITVLPGSYHHISVAPFVQTEKEGKCHSFWSSLNYYHRKVMLKPNTFNVIPR